MFHFIAPSTYIPLHSFVQNSHSVPLISVRQCSSKACQKSSTNLRCTMSTKPCMELHHIYVYLCKRLVSLLMDGIIYYYLVIWLIINYLYIIRNYSEIYRPKIHRDTLHIYFLVNKKIYIYKGSGTQTRWCWY